MGQYHMTVNLDKREFIMPHKLGAGLKLWEQLANDIGPGKALVVLLAHPDQRGGGDFDVDKNWHGPERKDMTKEGPMPEEYPAIAKRTIGRWRGDRIAIIGDYAEDDDIEGMRSDDDPISQIYGLCADPRDQDDHRKWWTEQHPGEEFPGFYTDVTDDVCKVIEHELNGVFMGDGWSRWVQVGGTVSQWVGKDADAKCIEGTVTEINATSIIVEWPKKKMGQYPRDKKPDFF